MAVLRIIPHHFCDRRVLQDFDTLKVYISLLLNATHKTRLSRIYIFPPDFSSQFRGSEADKTPSRPPETRRKEAECGPRACGSAAGRIDRERPYRETHPQDCLSSHGNILEQSWRMIVLLRCWGCSVTPCCAGLGISKLKSSRVARAFMRVDI